MGATEDDFNTIRTLATEDEIMIVMRDLKGLNEVPEKKPINDPTEIAKAMGVLSKSAEFKIKDGVVYLAGIERSLPPLLIMKFAELVSNHGDSYDLRKDTQYLSLKRFFMWCCLNPRAEVADLLYGFLVKNRMRITKQGFFVALRNVVEVEDGEDKEIVHFISNAYNKVKGVWKKDPSKFEVYLDNSDNGYAIHKSTGSSSAYRGTWIGNLKDLYTNLPDMKENRFTDNWTRTFDIRIGKVVKMPLESCDWSVQDCAAAGLHFAGYTAPYVLCGDTTVFTLHNPMKVVGIGSEKGRCYEYLPFMTTSVEEADEIMNSDEFDFLQLDEAYAIHELEDLQAKAQEGFVKELTKYKFNLPPISAESISMIVNDLETMKKEISSRVVNL